jgi:GT2 family glycosyltransferase
MNQTKFRAELAAVIPVMNQLKYTKKMADTLTAQKPFYTIFIDNNSTDGTREYLKEKSKTDGIISLLFEDNNGAAGSWNIGIRFALKALKCSKIAVLNNDILLMPDTLDRLFNDLSIRGTGLTSAKDVSEKCADEGEFFHSMNGKINSYLETPNFSCFAINRYCIERVGYFDEAFYPAYFEDNDYHHRMKLENLNATCNYGNYFFHFGSRTRQSDAKFTDYIKGRYLKNQAYYLKKWGGLPGFEKYKTPFNGKPPDSVDITLFEDYKNDLDHL